MNDWSGALLLSGNNDVGPVLEPLLQVGPHIIGGNACDCTVTTRTQNDLEGLEVRPGLMVACGTPIGTTNVPSRGLTIELYGHGLCQPGFEQMLFDLVHVLENNNRDKVPYATLIRRNVFATQAGKYAVQCCTYGQQTGLVLAHTGSRLYLWSVCIDATYLIVWSTDAAYVQRIEANLFDARANTFSYMPVDLPDRFALALNPKFLISKLRHVRSDNRREREHPSLRLGHLGRHALSPMAYAANYMRRLAQEKA